MKRSFRLAVFELFSDVSENEWYTASVSFVSSRGLFKGTGSGIFSPQGRMTRGMFVTVLGRLAGIDESQFSGSSFNDVSDNAWYASSVEWTAINNIVSGYNGGLFGPDDDISREQMTIFLYRYAKWSGYDVSAGSNNINVIRFTDAGNISDWAVESVNWAAGIGLINGKPGNIIDPKGKATRAEVATIIHRFVIMVLGK